MLAPGISAAAKQCCGDGTDGEGGHHQDDVAGDRGVEAGLTLVQSEAVLAELGISSTVMFGGNRRLIVLITLAASPRW